MVIAHAIVRVLCYRKEDLARCCSKRVLCEGSTCHIYGCNAFSEGFYSSAWVRHDRILCPPRAKTNLDVFVTLEGHLAKRGGGGSLIRSTNVTSRAPYRMPPLTDAHPAPSISVRYIQEAGLRCDSSPLNSEHGVDHGCVREKSRLSSFGEIPNLKVPLHLHIGGQGQFLEFSSRNGRYMDGSRTYDGVATF